MSETDTTTPAVIEPTLPGMELPTHFGRAPITQTTKINGSGSRILGEHEVGSKVYLFIEAKVKSSGKVSEDADGNLDYSEAFAVNDLFEIHGEAGPRMLSALREAYRTSDDTVTDAGRVLVEGVTDSSGVMMTAEEVAQLRGDPLAAAFDKRMAPVVVVYSDEARQMWPQEFEQMTPRPLPGDVYELEGGQQVVVREVLDAVTGERLGVWTDDDERERLDGEEGEGDGEEG